MPAYIKPRSIPTSIKGLLDYTSNVFRELLASSFCVADIVEVSYGNLLWVVKIGHLVKQLYSSKGHVSSLTTVIPNGISL